MAVMSKSMFNAPHFQSVEAARTYLEALRWGTDRVCAHCGTVNESFATKKPGVYRCRVKECRKDFSVTTKSVMESSHIKLNVWLQAFFLMASSKKGMSSHQLHRALGITYKSAWFLTHRIREAMRDGGLLPPREIRNQFSHCQWISWHRHFGLKFVNLEDVAAMSGTIRKLATASHDVSLAILQDQEAYFSYVMDCFHALAQAYKCKVAVIPNLGLPRPAKMARPQKHS
jgi:transposase-like protein